MKFFLHLLRVMFGNNYGIYPRKVDDQRLSYENNRPGLRLLMRALLLMSNLWLIPAIVVFFFFLPSLRFFVSEPTPALTEHETEKYTLLKDVSYEMTDLDGKPEKRTIAKGTPVNVKYRLSNRIYIEDAAGNRHYTDSPEEALGIDDYEYLPEISDHSSSNIYTDKDIEDRFLGEPLEEVETHYHSAEPVIRKSDGSRIAYFGGISEKKDGSRKNGLTFLVDSKGIIQDFAFTGTKKVRAGVLDYIPFVSKVLDNDGVRRFIRGINRPDDTQRVGGSISLSIGGANAHKWYFAIINLAVALAVVGSLLTPAAMVPFYIILLILMPGKSSNAKMVNIGIAVSLLIFVTAAFLVCLSADTGTALLIVVPSAVLAYFFFIPEIHRELGVLRCDTCAAWNSSVLVNVIRGECRTVTRTTTTTRQNSNTVDVNVSEWDEQWVTYEYQCEECEQVLQISRWEVV